MTYITALQPVPVIMILSKGNAIKSAAHTLYNEPPDKDGKIKRVGCRIRKKDMRLTDCY